MALSTAVIADFVSMFSMKRLLLLTCIAFFAVSCFAQGSKSYTIKGKIFNLSLNGEKIDLVEFGDGYNNTIQNAIVKNNEFIFTGTVDKPTLWMLLIEDHKILLVAENADLSVELYPDSSRISGTKINEDFQAFIDKSNAYRKQITEQYAVYQALPKDSPAKDSLQKQFEEMEKSWHSQVIVKFIEENINNPAGQRAFKSLLPDLSINELKNIIANVDSANMQIPLIQQGIERINASEKQP